MFNLNNVNFNELKHIITYTIKPFHSRINYYNYFNFNNIIIRIRLDEYFDRIIIDDIFIYNFSSKLLCVFTEYDKTFYSSIYDNVSFYKYEKCINFISQIPEKMIYDNIQNVEKNSFIYEKFESFLRKYKIERIENIFKEEDNS